MIQRYGQGKSKLKRDKECTHHGAPPRARLGCPSPRARALPLPLAFFCPLPLRGKVQKNDLRSKRLAAQPQGNGWLPPIEALNRGGANSPQGFPPFLRLVPRVWTAPLSSSRPEASTRSVCSVLPRPPPLGLVKLTIIALVTNTAFSSSHCTTSVKGLRGLSRSDERASRALDSMCFTQNKKGGERNDYRCNGR